MAYSWASDWLKERVSEETRRISRGTKGAEGGGEGEGGIKDLIYNFLEELVGCCLHLPCLGHLYILGHHNSNESSLAHLQHCVGVVKDLNLEAGSESSLRKRLVPYPNMYKILVPPVGFGRERVARGRLEIIGRR